jgi:hypothetical protein
VKCLETVCLRAAENSPLHLSRRRETLRRIPCRACSKRFGGGPAVSAPKTEYVPHAHRLSQFLLGQRFRKLGRRRMPGHCDYHDPRAAISRVRSSRLASCLPITKRIRAASDAAEAFCSWSGLLSDDTVVLSSISRGYNERNNAQEANCITAGAARTSAPRHQFSSDGRQFVVILPARRRG